MPEYPGLPLRVVDGCALDTEYRHVLRPGESVATRGGMRRALPRYFLEVPSWDVALETRLSPHFALWEFMNVDVREHELLRTTWPRYLPCAIAILATHLELLRREVDTYVHIAANGGYRSPAHTLADPASPHCWGTAVNLYRIGDDWLNAADMLARYRDVVQRLLPGARVLPAGDSDESDDHLHLDLGYVTAVPGGDGGEEAE
jgi:hypothetical protein